MKAFILATMLLNHNHPTILDKSLASPYSCEHLRQVFMNETFIGKEELNKRNCTNEDLIFILHHNKAEEK
jgi:hypothetical protein